MPPAYSPTEQGGELLFAEVQFLNTSERLALPITGKLRKRMGSYRDQFFHARWNNAHGLKLGDFAPWQEWPAAEQTVDAAPVEMPIAA